MFTGLNCQVAPSCASKRKRKRVRVRERGEKKNRRVNLKTKSLVMYMKEKPPWGTTQQRKARFLVQHAISPSAGRHTLPKRGDQGFLQLFFLFHYFFVILGSRLIELVIARVSCLLPLVLSLRCPSSHYSILFSYLSFFLFLFFSFSCSLSAILYSLLASPCLTIAPSRSLRFPL